jgi:glycosyltransferase involved in cell wall biosynthesis
VRGVTVDIAGASMGGAARYVAELRRYLASGDRGDVRVIGSAQSLTPQWLLRRETCRPASRRVALNNVSFCSPGGARWTLLGNALHFLSEPELGRLDPALRAGVRRQARVVRMAALRSDVAVAPCSAMAERVIAALPAVRQRVIVRPHPVSAGSVPAGDRDLAILVPVLFAPYKRMRERLTELIAALDDCASPARLRVTADAAEAGLVLAGNPRIELLGRLRHDRLRQAWASSRAVYFPTTLESFGYPLAEARAYGFPVIARDTAQNREIAGPALCPFHRDHPASLRAAVQEALTAVVAPDPAPFDPGAYFGWLLDAPA